MFKVEGKLERAIADKVPPHMQEGVINYLENGVHPGGFLSELLQGKISAFFHADATNRACMQSWVDFLYQDMPGLAWGTEDRFNQWLEARRLDLLPEADQ